MLAAYARLMSNGHQGVAGIGELSSDSPAPPPVLDMPLTFTAEEADSTVQLYASGSPSEVHIEFSVDNGTSWKPYAIGTSITLADAGSKVMMRASDENQTFSLDQWNCYCFSMSGKMSASGNIQTLLKSDGTRADAPAYCYHHMFFGCPSLTMAPELPATVLAEGCYYGMFTGCMLTTTPDLPATMLADSCYFNMFAGCASLTTASPLPAAALADKCYSGMFFDCKKLTSLDVSFSSWSPANATTGWVRNAGSEASGEKTFTCPENLPEMYGMSYIPDGWTVVRK